MTPEKSMKPEWMTEHENSDLTHFKEINDKLDGLVETLKPISDTYSTVTTLGKWAMTVAVFISILVGIIMGVKSFLFK